MNGAGSRDAASPVSVSLSLSSVLWLRRSGLVQSLHASTLQVFPVL